MTWRELLFWMLAEASRDNLAPLQELILWLEDRGHSPERIINIGAKALKVPSLVVLMVYLELFPCRQGIDCELQ